MLFENFYEFLDDVYSKRIQKDPFRVSGIEDISRWVAKISRILCKSVWSVRESISGEKVSSRDFKTFDFYNFLNFEKSVAI